MENLYIQVQNGQIINHPATEENLLQAFGSIPSDWEKFIKTEPPKLSIYQKLEVSGSIYQKINDVWTDVWQIIDITDAEKQEKQQNAKNKFNSLPNAFNFVDWIFDEDICSYKPPISKPTDGQEYFWSGLTSSWKVIPPKPTDGQNYKLSYLTDEWQIAPEMPDDGKKYVFKQQMWAWVENTNV
jgi:hypothetical protein